MIPERQHHAALAQWLNARPQILWTTIASENTGARTGRHKKHLGVKRGVPDILIFTPPPMARRPQYVGVAIELKRADGGKGASKVQREWLDALAALGWFAFVANGAQDAIDQLVTLGW